MSAEDPLKINTPKSPSDTDAKVVSLASPENIAGIADLQKQIVPEGWQFSEQYLKELIESPECLTVELKDGDSVVGFISGKPHELARHELLSHDPRMPENENAMYVDAIGLLEQYRTKTNLLKLMLTFAKSAESRGISRFSMHARRQTGFSENLLKAFKQSKLLYSIDDWYGTGEKFDYIEISVDKNDIEGMKASLT